MRKVLSMRAVLVFCMIIWVIMARMLSGCSVSKDKLDKVKDLEFTVVGEEKIPQDLKEVIDKKKALPFKLTYSDDTNLYIIVGYGAQESGGYSITVKQLYLTDNAVVVDTELLGPDTTEKTGTEKSYPYIVIKTEYLEQPMIFQ